MARIVSFVVLVAILLLIAALFFQVMASFLLPMFLALLLVIMFRPLHRWILDRCRGQQHVAAGLTTAAILIIVLLPVIVIALRVVSESAAVYHEIDPGEINVQKLADRIVHLSDHVGLYLNPSDVRDTVSGKVQEWLYPLARGTTQFIGQFLMSLLVMVFSLYYFLADGPSMVRTIMRFSPLDERYKQPLVEQFVNVSRAVVLATLLSAIIQGVLAGIGFYLVGFSSLVLLVVLAMLLAMVPFIGSPMIWIGACLWLYFYEDRPTAAIALGIYGAIILATVDNIVRPAVLRGRSNLHPLLGLLSVLGGMQALGAIGIFVGPMVVALLQTLLEILRRELEVMGRGKEGLRSSDLGLRT